MNVIHAKIKSADDLVGVSKDALERQANLMLYGTPLVLEDAMERQIFRTLYVPRNLNKPLVYQLPKKPKSTSIHNAWLKQSLCIDCGRPRHYNGASRCKFCYLLRSRLKFYEAHQGASWIESQVYGAMQNAYEGEQRVGVVMPVTEWWDDSDMPAYRYIASAQWTK